LLITAGVELRAECKALFGPERSHEFAYFIRRKALMIFNK